MPAEINFSFNDSIKQIQEEVEKLDFELTGLDQGVETQKKRVIALQDFPLQDELKFPTQTLDDIEIENANSHKKLMAMQTELGECAKELGRHQDTLQKKQDEYEKLEQARKLYVDIHNHGRSILCEEASVYLVAVTKNDLHATAGTGMDFVRYETMPRAEEQLFSIEREIEAKKKELASSGAALLEYEKSLGLVLEEKRIAVQKILTNANQLSINKNNIYNMLCEMENLFAVYQENSISGAAARGDIQSLTSLMLVQSPNKKDEYGHLPIYYASRFGQAQAVNRLFDATNLTLLKKTEILNVFPDKSSKEFTMLVTLLRQNKADFDYLWSENKSLGDNISAVFSDYFSPAALPLLPDEVKLILTGNWNRPAECLDLAKKIVDLFVKLEPKDRESESLCRSLMVSKWDTFHQQMVDNPNSESFARRFFYINDKVSLISSPAIKKLNSFATTLSKQPTSMWQQQSHKQPQNTLELEPLQTMGASVSRQ